jgi:hypothetical protein
VAPYRLKYEEKRRVEEIVKTLERVYFLFVFISLA